MVKNLRKLRLQRGISQQTLASALGISQQSINKYENHSIEPDITTLIAISDYFGVTVDHLIGRSEDLSKLTDGERELLADYRTLSEPEKICVHTLIKTYRKLNK